MKVIFVPQYGRMNPYLHRLGEALRSQGISAAIGKGRAIFPILGAIFSLGKPTILHLHWTDPYLVGKNRIQSMILATQFICELLAIRIIGTKLVWTIHNLFNHERKIKGERFINKILIALCNQVIVHGSFAKNEVMTAYRLAEKTERKLNVIPHGNFIDSYENRISQAEARGVLGIEEKVVVFLYFGLMRPYKGIPQLLKAFGAIQTPHANLILAGYPQTEDLKQEILKHSEWDTRVRSYLLKVPAEQIQLYMNASNVVVLPFQNIFTSGSLLLAMSFGKAVIAPKLNFLQEVLSPDGAIFYESSEPDGLQQALNKAIHVDLTVMGHQNYEKAKSFGWDEVGKKTLNAYEKCLSE